jgi:7-carboxy-7-deazaguanine synthase
VRIAEIFHSIQGEGQFTGTPSAFVRTSGCNLRCWFCDTPYTSWQPEGPQMPWRDVVDRVLSFGCEHVVVTGGEPMLPRDIVPLTKALADHHRFVTIETAGTVYRPVHADLMSISPKLGNSTPPAGRSARWRSRHESLRQNLPIVSRLIAEFPYQLKFVVDRREDLAEMEAYLRLLPDTDAAHVWLMPQAMTREQLADQTAWLEPEARRLGFQFSSRRHIDLFGNVRGR